MLEWYREHFDLTDLMADIERLIEQIAPNSHFQRHSYRSLMQQHLDIDPHTASARQLSSLARRLCAYEGELDTADALDLLFSVCIQPKLVQGFHLVFHYPRVQPGLALIADDERGTPVAKRVELFSRGLELGNGYHELLDADLLLARFNADNAELARRNKPLRPIDTAFLQAHRTGVPRCAGMALGIERLLMALDSIDDIRLLNPLHAG